MKNVFGGAERITHSAQETMDFACGLAEGIKLGALIALEGELGAGKTTFTKGFARGLGIKDEITSPTFTIVQEYVFESNGKKARFYHIDLYRLTAPEEAYALGIDEILSDENSIKIVEWAERLGRENLPQNRVEIRMIFDDLLQPEIRNISIRSV